MMRRYGAFAAALALAAATCGGSTADPDPTSTVVTAAATTISPATTAAPTTTEAPPTTQAFPPFTYAEGQFLDAQLSAGISTAAVSDLDGDGRDDVFLAITSGLDTGEPLPPLILLSDGRSLAEGTTGIIDGAVPTLFNVRDIVVADFNGDARPDLFLSNHGKEEPAGDWQSWPCEQNRLLLSQPSGRLLDVTDTALPSIVDFSHGSAPFDYDDDGDIDVFVNNLGCGSGIASYLLRNDGTGVFELGPQASDIWPAGRSPGGYASPDWSQGIRLETSDGVVHTSFDDAGLLVPGGAGGLADIDLPGTAPGRVTQGSAAADLDGDGDEDVVLLQTPDDYSPGVVFQVLISHGNDGFADETADRLPEQRTGDAQGMLDVWVVDVEGDGDQDILYLGYGLDWHLGSDVFGFYINDGSGSFSELDPALRPPIHPPMIPLDVNGDDRIDFVYIEEGRLALSLAR